MILLIVLAVVVVAVAAAGLLGIGVLSGDNRRGRPAGGLAALAVPVVAVMGVVVVAVLALGLVGGRSGSHEGQPSPAAPTTTTTTAATAAPRAGPAVVAEPRATLQPVSGSMPVVSIRAAADDRLGAFPLVSGLTSGSVVEVRAEGFAEFERGRIEQCVVELARQTACAPAFPVQFDIDGRADFQFAVVAEIAPGGCRVGQATCLLRLTGEESGRHGVAQTVVGEWVPGTVSVTPDHRVVEGQAVEVSVRGFPPGVSATAVLCAPPAPYDVERCTNPGPASTFAVDTEGSGRTALVVSAGRLCGPGRRCGVTVVVGPGFVAAPAAPITFSTGPGVSYERDRVIPGVAVALVLVALAFVLARRTDWAKPTEADTPELDDADLRSDRSLDDLFGTDEDLDERDPIPW